jgi:hypothetical protein
MIYADSSISIWHMVASEVYFFKGTQSEDGHLESADFDGGPFLQVGEDFFNYGNIRLILVSYMERKISTVIVCDNNKKQKVKRSRSR